jgi:MORN repeat variant
MSADGIGDTAASAAPGPEIPPRPAAVPAEAAWSVDTGEWEVASVDGSGQREGLCRAWRPDGSLASEYHYRAGARHGAFRRFHPDGALAREGAYAEGQPHGTITAHGHERPTPEPLQSCCVPPGAWQLQLDYEQGRMNELRWYDRAGVHIMPSGVPHPARPATVPRHIRYEEGRKLWIESHYTDDAAPDGVWRRWATDGVLRERDEYRAGKAHGLWQRWDETGTLMEEGEWRNGQRGGAYRRVGVPPDLYQDTRGHEERGGFDRDQAVGAWVLLDAAGVELHRFDLGGALSDDDLRASPALAQSTPPSSAAAWEATGEDLARQGRPVEAILAAARAAAASGDAASLRRRLLASTHARHPDSAANLASDLIARADGGLALMANGLVSGADAAGLLRALAASLTGRDRAALDLVNAALLLSPERSDCLVTRALINVHMGRPEAARADAAALPDDLQEQRSFLESYTQVIFTAFPFVPARTDVRTLFPDVPEGPEQSLANVQAQVRKYATHLEALRGTLVARLDPGAAPPWLPPSLAHLLPEGPVPLETWEFEEIVEDESDGVQAGTDAKPEPTPTLVKVEEQLLIEAETPLPSLLRLARREWNGLCWLCWSAGLDQVAMPTAIVPPADFGLAAGMSVERTWRCRDKLTTGGLRALTQGLPGFTWEGFEIELLPTVLAQIATEEYLEMRALFYWLCDAGVQSPWQDNLRAD